MGFTSISLILSAIIILFFIAIYCEGKYYEDLENEDFEKLIEKEIKMPIDSSPKEVYTVKYIVTIEVNVNNKSEALKQAFNLINYCTQESDSSRGVSSIALDSIVDGD
jgi:nitrogen fixation-related uncharacterized protein